MKKILLVVLVMFGLNPTQAQINICDSVSISGSQYQSTIEVNNINTIMYYWETTGSNGLYTLSEDSMTNQHLVYNYNPTTGLPYDTILTCANTNLTTCCWTFIWDGTMWLRMGAPSQITCDSITTTYLNITPNSIDVTTNSMSLGVQFPMHSWDLYEGCQNALLTYSDTTVNTTIPLPSPNLVDTFVFCNWSDYGVAPYSCYSCDTFAWNGSNWAMMTQQPYFCCDSITYWTDQSQGFNVGLDTTGIVHNPDSMDVWWSVCTNGLCYSGQGMYDYFPQVMTTDTLKVCYDVMLWESGVLEVCTHCDDSLVFDGNNWVLLNTNNTTSINELTFNRINDNKMYDLLGREVTEAQIGVMYIRNNKKYIRVK